MSSLRGIRIQRNRPSMEPKPLMQSPSSSASDEEEEWNKGFSTTYQNASKVPDQTTAGKPKTMGPKSRTMGPKSKTSRTENKVVVDEDDLQLALALSMDPKEQASKEHEQFLAACEKSKQDSSTRGSSGVTQKSANSNSSSSQSKKAGDTTSRPFTKGNAENWLDDDISSDDEKSLIKNKSSQNSKKPNTKNNKNANKKPTGPKSRKRERLSSDDDSADEGKSDAGETNAQKADEKETAESTNRNLSTTTEDEDEMISKYPKNSKTQKQNKGSNENSKKKPSRAQKNTKQKTKRPKYKEVSSSEEEENNSDSEEEIPNKISKANPIISNKEYQPAPKRTFSKRKPSGDASDVSEDGEYVPMEGETKKSSRQAKSRDEKPEEAEAKQSRPMRGKPSKPSYGKHPIPNDQIIEYVGSERLLSYITCIAKQIVDSQRMRLFVDMYQNKNLEIDPSHPLYEMAPLDFYKDDGEIDKKLEELLERPFEAGKEVLTDDGNIPFDDESKQKFLRFVLIPECIIHLLKKQFTMGDQEAEEFYQQSESKD